MFSEEFLEQNRRECEEEERQFKASGGPQKEAFKQLLNNIYQENDTYDIKYQKLDNLPGILYVKEKIYAIEGGTCWDQEDEDNSYEMIVSDKSIIYGIEGKFSWLVKNNLSELNLPSIRIEEWINNNIRTMSKHSYIKDFHKAEYYGNSSTYGIFEVDFDKFLKKVCSEKDYQYYEEVKKDFKPETKNKKGWSY